MGFPMLTNEECHRLHPHSNPINAWDWLSSFIRSHSTDVVLWPRTIWFVSLKKCLISLTSVSIRVALDCIWTSPPFDPLVYPSPLEGSWECSNRCECFMHDIGYTPKKQLKCSAINISIIPLALRTPVQWKSHFGYCFHLQGARATNSPVTWSYRQKQSLQVNCAVWLT